MPKKNSAWGTNTKSVEAKEKKNEKKRGEQEAKQKAVDDALWKDENKLDQKKKDRKEKDQQKKLEALSRKQESKKLLDEEEKGMAATSKSASSSSGKGKKVTLSEIEKVKEVERKKQEKLNESKKKEKSNVTEVRSEMECDNPNREMAELLAAENAVEARSVGDAVAVLNIDASDAVEDQHPEKRMKAAYNDFEAIRLPILKKENPSLRHTQLKQMLWKEWQKSPENPMNI